MQDLPVVKYARIASYVLMAGAVLFVLHFGLLAALLSGLLVYSLVHMLAPRLERHFSSRRAKLIAVAGLGVILVGGLSLLIWGLVVFFKSDAGNTANLLQRLADILDASRAQMPAMALDYMPEDAAALRDMLTNWLREHANEAKGLGEAAGRAAAHLLIGMIIGAMAALRDAAAPTSWLPLASAMVDRLAHLSDAFERIVFAQVRIAAINALLTGLYLLVVLPLMGIHLPLAKSLILITFLAGLLPVVGNLLSNTLVVIVGLAHSLNVALGSLLFLILVHKLEYFLNARIIGSHIQARAWELLVAMLAMEAVFGLYGVIAAPVLYAYIKLELMEKQLI
jgi:predicted PurR-regulated permease PerM